MMSADESDEEYQEDGLGNHPLQSPTKATTGGMYRKVPGHDTKLGTSSMPDPLRNTKQSSHNARQFSIGEDSPQPVTDKHLDDLDMSSNTESHAILNTNQDDEYLKVETGNTPSNAQAGTSKGSAGVGLGRPNGRLSDDDNSMTMADQLQEAADTHLIGQDGSTSGTSVDPTGSRTRQLLDDVRNSSVRKHAIQQRLRQLSAERGGCHVNAQANAQAHTTATGNGGDVGTHDVDDDRPASQTQPRTHSPTRVANVSVSVTNPTQVGEGMRAYMAYDVRSRHGTVHRRYNDFAWLHAQLRESCPGVILPALPDKQPLGRFDSDFVDKRCVMLDAYLGRIAAHPDLGRAGAYLEFCTTLKALPSLSSRSEKFETVLKEHIGMADALSSLFRNRAQLIRKCSDAQKALAVQRQNTARSATASIEDPGAAENSLDEAEKKAVNLKQELAHLSTTIKREAVHLDDERATDLSLGMLAYARMRVEIQRQIVDAWAKCKAAVLEAETATPETPSPTPLTS
ncbi:hypothetical protein SARC_11134 [Sphaeroforma arctica JP610]|uniref:PX domain-containing protein n=1 Tax=Sphaeroforma arctica JP610 TaxID=667725 RepID=A0A0L0FHU9_9EUKA|nr:hypothetical protein SARC_11134 [Sphaeroforma arctica JP610]KNC76364.1 hypothetical protein SARC_11134 [Sphaeroforma arctica JP610]|eukprot:XP_014150266.1 hypothetical protein SARC_11134 [Sphaeroforma arctica JP610]